MPRAAEHDEHDDAEGDEQHRDELRRRQQVEDGTARISAIELDEESGHRVQEEIGPERPPRESTAASFEQQEHSEDA